MKKKLPGKSREDQVFNRIFFDEITCVRITNGGCRNLLERAEMLRKIYKNPKNFYPLLSVFDFFRAKYIKATVKRTKRSVFGRKKFAFSKFKQRFCRATLTVVVCVRSVFSFIFPALAFSTPVNSPPGTGTTPIPTPTPSARAPTLTQPGIDLPSSDIHL